MNLLSALDLLTLSSRVLHLLGAIVLVGGVFYLRMVVASSSAAAEGDWFGGKRGTWAKWAGIATVVLLVTGLLNFVWILKTHEKLDPSYHMLFGIKFLLAFVLFFLTAIVAGKTAVAEKFRQRMRMWLSLCLLLGILIVILGSTLRSIPRVLKTETLPTTSQEEAPAP